MEEIKAKRRTRRPRCIKGQRHRWLMGKAVAATDSGQLTSGDGQLAGHLMGTCRKCHKVRRFHPYAAKRRVFGQFTAKRRAA